ncbi:hypothetical protein GF327_03770 [Candidatus Woesearchaeota archaeon]|nr:hypothetical protein [Candidatus Woesearchaeota archaeon]
MFEKNRKIFPITFSIPEEARSGTYLFHFNICYFDAELYPNYDGGCNTEQNRKLGSSKKIYIEVA